MKLSTFTIVKKTDFSIDNINLSVLPCGLFRCPLNEAQFKMPALKELYDSAPVTDPENWELDVKIHMLMKDQYPCIPNWHCDNVPRIDGKLQYDKIDPAVPDMYLWVSDSPLTEFLAHDTNIGRTLKDHSEIAPLISEYKLDTVTIPAATWVSMRQNTPHRGTAATGHTWRVFARLTHKSISPARPVDDVIRRHCQVYLDSTNFTW